MSAEPAWPELSSAGRTRLCAVGSTRAIFETFSDPEPAVRSRLKLLYCGGGRLQITEEDLKYASAPLYRPMIPLNYESVSDKVGACVRAVLRVGPVLPPHHVPLPDLSEPNWTGAPVGPHVSLWVPTLSTEGSALVAFTPPSHLPPHLTVH